MRPRYLAVLVGLGISVFTSFYLLTLLLVTDHIVLPSPVEMGAPRSLSVVPSGVQAPVSEAGISDAPLPTVSPGDGLNVTDPRMIILGTDDVPRDLRIDAGFTRYVDNAALIRNSSTPEQTQLDLLASGRLNGFQTAFRSDDPIASQLRSKGILHFAEVYQNSDQAQRAWQDSPELLAARFPSDGQIKLERELTVSESVGDALRCFEGYAVSQDEKVSLYAMVYCRKNTLVGILLQGGQRDKIVRDGWIYAELVDKRIRSFGKGLSA